MAWIVQREPATGHPDGLEFAAAIAWRGVIYGFADGVILSAFPIVAVFAAFEGKQRAQATPRQARGRRARARRLAPLHGRLSPRLLRLPRREAAQAAGGRCDLERPDPCDAEPTRLADHARGAARQRGRPQLRHGHVPATAPSVGRCSPARAAGDSGLPGRGSRPHRARRDCIRPRRTGRVARRGRRGRRPERRADAGGCPHAARERVEDLDRRSDPPAGGGRKAAAVGQRRTLAARSAALRRSDHRRAAAGPQERADRQQRRREEPRCLHRRRDRSGREGAAPAGQAAARSDADCRVLAAPVDQARFIPAFARGAGNARTTTRTSASRSSV